MSLFTAKLRVANMAAPAREAELELMVDTGAAYSWISRQRLAELGIEPTGRLKFQAIDGHILERDVAPVRVGTDGRTDRKSTRLNSSHIPLSRMPSSA